MEGGGVNDDARRMLLLCSIGKILENIIRIHNGLHQFCLKNGVMTMWEMGKGINNDLVNAFNLIKV
jgi:hypothetical protein